MPSLSITDLPDDILYLISAQYYATFDLELTRREGYSSKFILSPLNLALTCQQLCGPALAAIRLHLPTHLNAGPFREAEQTSLSSPFYHDPALSFLRHNLTELTLTTDGSLGEWSVELYPWYELVKACPRLQKLNTTLVAVIRPHSTPKIVERLQNNNDAVLEYMATSEFPSNLESCFGQPHQKGLGDIAYTPGTIDCFTDVMFGVTKILEARSSPTTRWLLEGSPSTEQLLTFEQKVVQLDDLDVEKFPVNEETVTSTVEMIVPHILNEHTVTIRETLGFSRNKVCVRSREVIYSDLWLKLDGKYIDGYDF